jgi:hypothetical protein
MNSEWRKSTYSNTNGGACVEVAANGGVLVRDTVNREGFTLPVSTAAWAAFTSGIK